MIKHLTSTLSRRNSQNATGLGIVHVTKNTIGMHGVKRERLTVVEADGCGNVLVNHLIICSLSYSVPKYCRNVLAMCVALFQLVGLIGIQIFAQTPPTDPHWELLWQDDFNYFDHSRWDIARSADHSGEPQLYLPDNVSISSEGELVLSLLPTPVLCSDNSDWFWVGGGPCIEGVVYPMSSGFIETNSLNDILFGYIEARIKMPRMKYYFVAHDDAWYETWPAFWTYRGHGDQGYGSNENEIDIFEAYGGSMPWNQVGTNVHEVYATQNGPPAVNHPSDVELVGDYAADYHVYGIQWDKEKIIWYYDGMPVRTYAGHAISAPARVILNLATKFTDAVQLPEGTSMDQVYPKPLVVNYPSPPEPSYMYVDYVRVYKLKEACEEVIHTNTFDYSNYPLEVVNYISIGNSGQWVQGNGTAYLRASEFVEFTADYTFPLGTDLHAEAVATCTTYMSGSCQEHFFGCNIDAMNFVGQVKFAVEIEGGDCLISAPSAQVGLDIRAAKLVYLGPTTEILPNDQAAVLLRIAECEY
ncbi:MAG: glycoside hydrolase family 16 protein [Flavobacteriales bacterium]|nr:glycoside hydrolase family 16 protein [Flavobacteriales bacterium]